MTHQMRHPPTLADERATLLALRRAIERRIEADIAFDALDLEPDECTELTWQAEIWGGARVRAAA